MRTVRTKKGTVVRSPRIEQSAPVGYGLDPESMTPVYDWIIMELVIKEKTTDGGVIIPESAQADAPLCVVLKVGPGSPVSGEDGVFRTPCVKVGDVVLMDQMLGSCIVFGNGIVAVRDKAIRVKLDPGCDAARDALKHAAERAAERAKRRLAKSGISVAETRLVGP